MKEKILTGVLCLMLFFALNVYAGGLEVGVTGGEWGIGNSYQNMVFSTSGNKWSITNSGDGSEYIFIRVEPDGSWAASDDGNNGPDEFVLREDDETGLIISTTDVRLAVLVKESTYNLDLWYKAPDENSTDTGVHNLTVVLTAKNWEEHIEDGEGQVVDDDLVKIGTGGGHYLIWPRPLSCPGTNNNGKLWWKDEQTAGEPCWDNDTKTYDYTSWCGPAGDCSSHCAKDNYSAFKFVEDLVWKGYDDWRLPTKDELKQLYDYGRTYISYNDSFYYSSSELDIWNAWYVSFSDGQMDHCGKGFGNYVRSVRGGP